MASATQNWRTINIDALDPDSPANFDISTLIQPQPAVSLAEVQGIAQQCRQLLRGGDAEGALSGAMDTAPYGGDEQAKDAHLATVVEILQSIKASDMTPMLTRIYSGAGGPERLDTLTKYLYKGMSGGANVAATSTATGAGARRGVNSPQTTGFSQISNRMLTGDGGGQAMSVLLSWHEKVVEIAGTGAIARVMTDRRTV